MAYGNILGQTTPGVGAAIISGVVNDGETINAGDVVNVDIRSTVDLSTAQVGDIIILPVNDAMVPHIVVHIGNPDSELYDASCDGVWVLRQDIVENGQWNSSGVNTLAGSTIMTAMQGYVDDYDSTVQAAIQTVKIPYCVGNGNWTVNNGSNGLECKIFPLGYHEVGGSGSNVPVDGAKLDYFLDGSNEPSANAKRIFKYNGSPGNFLLRSVFKISTYFSSQCGSNGILGQQNVTASSGYLPCFILPATFTATFPTTITKQNNPYQAIALTSGIGGDTISVMYSGIINASWVTAGQTITSTTTGVQGYGVKDGMLEVFPYYRPQ